MSKISIDLDLDVVQQALHAKVQPAVDKILAKQDINALIEKALEKPLRDDGDWGMNQLMMMRYSGIYQTDRKAPPLLETLVQNAIREAAQAFIKSHVKKQKAKIEEAFTDMLRDSPAMLAKMFVNSLEDGLENHWAFDFKANVQAIEPPERDRDYD